LPESLAIAELNNHPAFKFPASWNKRPGFQDPGIRFSGERKVYGIIAEGPGNVKRLSNSSFFFEKISEKESA